MGLKEKQHRRILPLILCILFFAVQAMSKTVDSAALEKQVAALQLGVNGYFVAHKLSEEQKALAGRNMEKKSYPGTFTFTDGDIHVLVDGKRDIILAIYEKKEKATGLELKNMVADLMMSFGDPTSEAHDQIIYWAYSRNGRISEDDYVNSKQEGTVKVIATVKFKSRLTFSDATDENAQENDIHWIISSPRLLEKFYNR
ncbi:hypothetical protein [Desulfomarina sp.]